MLNTNDRFEKNCVRDAILAATGVRTKSSFVDGTRPTHILYARIAHLGFLHNWLKEFVDPASGVMPQGLMGEGLVTAIKMELAEYYRSVALLQSQTCESSGSSGTLRRVCVWAQEPLHRLTWLTNITHTSQHKKGGELASCVHRFAQHGDERVAQLARRLLTALTYPLLVMLTRWLLHGIIDDPFNEFFIECRSTVGKGNMWHERYKVRQWMVPSFMSQEQAAQILATGKSVVFMREACADEPDSSDHAHHLQTLLKATTGDEGDSSSASSWWEADGLRAAVCAAHETATHRLLAALTTHHHLLDHLTAHRRYLLLTQGDFAHHLMTLIRDELNKPANSQYVHNLSCTLEAAVRATNAQFEPPHVLSRLYVNLVSEGDIRPEDNGWDVFVLQYRVEEPLDSVFHAQCQMQYRALFLQLWRIKRIEYNLHEDWRHHTILQKRLKYMPEVWSLMRRVSCFRAEALRMCSALQEACFVGAETAWAELFAAVAEHRDLDTLLHLHFVALERQSVDALIHKTTEQKGVPMTKEEVMQLVNLVEANPVLFSKATNASNNQLKEATWLKITNIFNSMTGGGKPEYIPPDEALEKVAAILGAGMATVPFGGDAQVEVTETVLDEGLVVDSAVVIPFDTDTEKLIPISPSPRPAEQKIFFINK
ncbi:Gamma-tubulin complex component 3 homolog [Eumeta japonica]|uniref:Gamma-tubulin complex component 3 homolog n=1 Tax=Eumeta variegata TaxID=151549 RepID=A0A4C1UZ53_EUMVA|nr:Gamma-tubulin complex component 3 homolog [Eumeta japonica]